MDDKYQEFINFLFDREESCGDWRFNFELTEIEITGN
jgi:hypothetical protein